MAQISSTTGLVSGIDSKSIIDQLIALEARQKDSVQARIDDVNKTRAAYADLSTRLIGIKLSGTVLRKPSSFQNAAASSSNEDVITATTTAGAAVGSYQFQVARLVTTQNLVSKGFADFDKTKVGAGTLTVEVGGGELNTENTLAQLNGGAGVRRGNFRITDRSGATAVIDVTSAVSLDDVVKKINTALTVQVRAKVDGDKLTLTDLSGKTVNDLLVSDIGDGKTAADLGLVGTSSTGAITGTNVNFISATTALNDLNDGRGVRTTTVGTPDIAVTLRNGQTISVDLSAAKTVGDTLAAINAAGTTKLKADFVPGSKGIRLTDTSGGGGTLSVASLNGSKAAEDLGLTAAATGATLNAADALGTLGTTLIRSLNGGAGFTLGTINIQNRAGASAAIDLSTAKTVDDVLNRINGANAGVTASLKSSGNGIQLLDTSAGAGNLVITDAAGTTAADFGIEGTYGTAAASVQGANLQRQWLNENNTLASINGGKGITAGTFTLTSALGRSARIDLTDAKDLRVGDVIARINAKNIGVTASINAKGDGILLTDTAGGAAKLKVEDEGSTTAKDLNIAGVATATTIDGTFEKTIAVTATDTLATLQTKINDTGFGASAAVINDGTGAEPYRLSLTARNSGRNGRVTLDAGATGLNTSTLVNAADAAVFLGDSANNGGQPLLITSSSNSLSGVIRGVNISLNGISDKAVTLSVARNGENVAKEAQTFTDNFNALADKLTELTKYDAETQTPGLLLGDATAISVQSQLYSIFTTSVVGGGKYRTLADVGLKLGDGGKIEFDADKFNTAYAADADSVSKLFTASGATIGSATLLSSLNGGRGVTRAAFGADLRLQARDGSKIDVTLGEINSIGDAVTAINAVGAGKIVASVGTTGAGLIITDTTTGTGSTAVNPLNGSSVANVLGISGTGKDGVLNGRAILTSSNRSGANSLGVGFLIENLVTKLTDPVSGEITAENKTLDGRTAQFKDRIDTLDKQLDSKRSRLERQFANLESVLSGLQGQQSALSGFKPAASS